MSGQDDPREQPADPPAAPADGERDRRRQAEPRVGALSAAQRDALSPAEAEQLIDELQVHQVEMELQNQDLRVAQQALEQSRDRYIAPCDFAPVGYASLTREGRVTQMNLTAAQLLGVERGRGPDPYLAAPLAAGDGRALFSRLRRVLATGEEESIEVGLGRPPAPQRDLQLLIRREHPGASRESTTCRVILLDIRAPPDRGPARPVSATTGSLGGRPHCGQPGHERLPHPHEPRAAHAHAGDRGDERPGPAPRDRRQADRSAAQGVLSEGP